MNKQIIDMLTEVAKANDVPFPARVAAAVVHRNKLISVGMNKDKSHPMQKRFQSNKEAIFLHAEIDAIKNAIKKVDDVDFLQKCVVYIVRVKKNGKKGDWIWGMAKPCAGCMRCIEAFLLKGVVYTTDNQTIKEIDYDKI